MGSVYTMCVLLFGMASHERGEFEMSKYVPAREFCGVWGPLSCRMRDALRSGTGVKGSVMWGWVEDAEALEESAYRESVDGVSALSLGLDKDVWVKPRRSALDALDGYEERRHLRERVEDALDRGGWVRMRLLDVLQVFGPFVEEGGGFEMLVGEIRFRLSECEVLSDLRGDDGDE